VFHGDFVADERLRLQPWEGPGGFPSRRVCETDLPEGGNRRGLIARNQKIKAKYKTSMKPPTITAYLKPTGGWSQGVRAMLRKHNLPYEDRDSHLEEL